jgi:hypothetical protein
MGQVWQPVGPVVDLNFPATQGSQRPSSLVDPVRVDWSVADGLLKPRPVGQVVVVMF